MMSYDCPSVSDRSFFGGLSFVYAVLICLHITCYMYDTCCVHLKCSAMQCDAMRCNVYKYIHMYINIYICIYIYTYVYIYMYIYVYICIHMYIYVYICIYMYIYSGTFCIHRGQTKRKRHSIFCYLVSAKIFSQQVKTLGVQNAQPSVG